MCQSMEDIKRSVNQVGDGGKCVILLNWPVFCQYMLLLIYLWHFGYTSSVIVCLHNCSAFSFAAANGYRSALPDVFD
jgi:hypothetical protein